MTAPDFAAILTHALYNRAPVQTDPYVADALATLAARVPEACQTCGGSGGVGPEWYTHNIGDPCPDCPTIGTLLAYGWNVATARGENPRFRDDCVWTSEDTCHTMVLDLLAALRTIPEVQS